MHLTMTSKEREYVKVLTRIKHNELTIANAAQSVQISERQMYRLLARYDSHGDAGIIHRGRGKPSARRIATQIRQQVIQLYRERYRDYGPTLFSEKLDDYHQITVSPKTITRILKTEHLYTPVRHRKPHRKKRDRRSCIGELVQFDGSDHLWFEQRGKKCCLLVAIDDASNRNFLRFAPSESTDSVFAFWNDYCAKYGIPCAIYTDRGTVYYTPDGAPTQYQRAMSQLNIECIYARSPQAKGRVERSNRTHQDRLLKALREHNISTIEQANEFLDSFYMDDHNARLATIEGKQDIHRSAQGINLDSIFCFHTTRTVYNDYTITLNSRYIQLLKGDTPLPPPRSKVTVKQYLDHCLHILWNYNKLTFEILKHKPPPKKKTPVKPKPNHPWRLKFVGNTQESKNICLKFDSYSVPSALPPKQTKT